MREIDQKYLDSAQDLLNRMEGCILDELTVSWRNLTMNFVWDKAGIERNPGDVSIQCNVAFDLLVDGTKHRFDLDTLQSGDGGCGSILRFLKSRVNSAEIDTGRLRIQFENDWEIVVHLDRNAFEPLILSDMRQPGSCLPL